MGHINASYLSTGAQAGKTQALAFSRAAADRAQAATGRAPKEIRDVVKLSDRALRMIDKVEARVEKLDLNSSKGAEKIADLQKKISEALDKLFEKAAKAGITLVIEDDTPAPAPAPAPKAQAPSVRELISAPTTPAPAAAKSGSVPAASSPSSSAPSSSAPSSSGLRSSNSGSGKPGLIAETTTFKSTGQARAAEVRSEKADTAPAADAAATAKAEAASKAEKRVVVIKASVLKEITDFKALSRLIADTDTKLTVAAGGGSVEEVVKMAAVQTVLRESSIDTSGADIRALKTYQTMVDLMQDNNRKATQGPGEDVSRRNHIDFAA